MSKKDPRKSGLHRAGKRAQHAHGAHAPQFARHGAARVAPHDAPLVRSKFTGRVVGHPEGHGFLAPDVGGAQIYLSAAEMRQVLHGDRALVRVNGMDSRGRPSGSSEEAHQT